MKVMNGQYPHGTYSGDILVAGNVVRMRSPREAAVYGIGIVPQEVSVIDTLSVGENVHLGRYGRGLTSVRSMNRSAQEFLDTAEMPLNATRGVGTLSVSDKQLVMIARTLYAQPQILILDEPTTALTDSEVNRLFTVVRTLTAQGVSTVLISHRLGEIFDLADEVAVLRDGRLVDHLTRPDFARDRIVNAIAGRELGELFPPRPEPSDRREVLRLTSVDIPDPRRGSRHVLTDVTLALHSGEVLGIGGALGSGRTELLEAIFGLVPTSSGTMSLNSAPFVPANPHDSIGAGIALVPEDRKLDGLYFNGSVEDNLTLSMLPRLSTRSLIRFDDRRKVAELEMRRFGITAAGRSAPIGSLSGGNQQKVLLARAIATAPSVLLLDEPTKGVDVGAKAEIYRLIRDAAAGGTAVIVVSSEVPELLGLCDRILVLGDGRIVSEVDAATATLQDLLAAAMSAQLQTHDGAP
jgi:ABC-type sugar transport system ATPase subunit